MRSFPSSRQSSLAAPLAPELRAEAQTPGELCTSSPKLAFLKHMPSVTVYNAGGQFSPHQDQKALTVLMPLVDEAAFEGGGTAFWSLDRVPTALGDTPPSLVLKPAPGTAFLFGGNLTHAGQPVTNGQRAVYVAAFSRASEIEWRPDAPGGS